VILSEATAISQIACSPAQMSTALLEANQNCILKVPLSEKVLSPNGVRLLACHVGESLLFYVDSGAGQCLCSNDSSFVDMTPCMVEITGIAGTLQIYGCGTALFLATDDLGRHFVLRVHNCLFGQVSLI
jgi:hypothetical protein